MKITILCVDCLQSYSNVSCVNAAGLPLPPQHRKRDSMPGFVFKVYALFVCSFHKVLLLDPDNMPLMNPSLFFEEESWKLTGNRFWPDFFQREGIAVVSSQGKASFSWCLE